MLSSSELQRVSKMTTLALARRQALSAGIAASVLTMARNGVCKSVFEDGSLPRVFTGSRTVTTFAAGLLFVPELPSKLKHTITSQLRRADVYDYHPFTRNNGPETIRTDTKTYCEADERRQAEFFAWLAVRIIAPRALRRAGYEALATGCEREQLLRPGGAAALAQHTIGREFRSSLFTPRAWVAYGTCAHASTCSCYVLDEKIETVVHAGYFCARALVETFCCEDPEWTEIALSSRLAVAAINWAVELGMENKKVEI